MKCLNSDAIPDLECPMCKAVVKAKTFTLHEGGELFNYQHPCYATFSIKDLEKYENYMNKELTQEQK